MRKTDAFKRDFQFNRVSFIIYFSLAVSDDIDAEIFLPAFKPGVSLDTQGIAIEGIEILVVIKGI